MQKMLVRLVALCGWLVLTSIPAFGQTPSLEGSPASVARMARQAELHDFSRMGTGAKILEFFGKKRLVKLEGDGNYRLDGVSYPYVRREVKLFVERLSSQSRGFCEDGLTVTSSARPVNKQPSNASPKSVHPMGMAIDFRIPASRRCRTWLEKTLLTLEGQRVLEATRETTPPHYHVAVFPRPYTAYLDVKKKTAAKLATKKSAPQRKK